MGRNRCGIKQGITVTSLNLEFFAQAVTCDLDRYNNSHTVAVQ